MNHCVLSWLEYCLRMPLQCLGTHLPGSIDQKWMDFHDRICFYSMSVSQIQVFDNPISKCFEGMVLSQPSFNLILISIKTRRDNIFGQKPPVHSNPNQPTHPPHHHLPGTQPCLILPKLLTFWVSHQIKSCLSILE